MRIYQKIVRGIPRLYFTTENRAVGLIGIGSEQEILDIFEILRRSKFKLKKNMVETLYAIRRENLAYFLQSLSTKEINKVINQYKETYL